MAARYENLPGAENPHLGADFPNVRDVLRHRGPLDATLPPTPIRELLAASGATLFVLATDAALVTTVRRAADQHPLFVVETWPELMEAVESGRCGIALIDAAVLGARVAHGVAALAAYADRLVTLVAADRAAAQDYVGFLSDGRIHRLVMKPLAIGATRLLIESATARRLQLREEPANDDASRRRRGGLEPISEMALAGGCRSGCRRVARRRDRGQPARVVGPSSAGSEQRSPSRRSLPLPRLQPRPCRRRRTGSPTIARRLRSRSSKADSRSPPATMPSITIFRFSRWRRRIRARAPAFRPWSTTLFTRAEEALLADSLEAAAAALDHVRRADPASSRLAFLDAQLARALAALAVTAPPANAATTARRRFTDGARQRAEPGHGPVAPRAAAEPCRRQREGLSRSRGGARSHRSARRGAAHRSRRGVDRGLASRVRFRCCGGRESRRGSAPARRRVRGAHRARERRRRRARA